MDFGTNQILITGANGWLGKTLIHSLIFGINSCNSLKNPQNKLKIKCLVLPGEDTNYISNLSENVEIFYGDISNLKDCQLFTDNAQGSILFHCAGVIHPSRIKHFYDINLMGTENLFISAVKNKIRKAVVISSNSPCGTNPNKNHLFDEDYKYNPYFNYGKSKMMMENLVKNYINKGDIEAVIIRPPWFYGPHQPNRQIRFYKMIRDGKVPIIGKGDNKRSMACTINISQGAILAALNKKTNGNIYWIADEAPYTFDQIISTIRNVMENEFEIICSNRTIRLPNFISEIAYYSDKLIQSFGMYNQEIHVLSEMNKTIACSIDKAKKELGYKPCIDLYEGTYISIKSALNKLK